MIYISWRLYGVWFLLAIHLRSINAAVWVTNKFKWICNDTIYILNCNRWQKNSYYNQWTWWNQCVGQNFRIYLMVSNINQDNSNLKNHHIFSYRTIGWYKKGRVSRRKQRLKGSISFKKRHINCIILCILCF